MMVDMLEPDRTPNPHEPNLVEAYLGLDPISVCVRLSAALGDAGHGWRIAAEVMDRVGDDDTAMAWWSFTGVHVGPWLDRPPTGERIESTVFSFFDITDGQISRYSLWLHAGFDEPLIFDPSSHTPVSPGDG